MTPSHYPTERLQAHATVAQTGVVRFRLNNLIIVLTFTVKQARAAGAA